MVARLRFFVVRVAALGLSSATAWLEFKTVAGTPKFPQAGARRT